MGRSITLQFGRAWRLGRDLGGVLRGVGRTLAWALGAPVDVQPVLARLEGEPRALAGAASAYRIRAYNPCADRKSLRVRIAGWLDAVPDARFGLEWEPVLEPGATIESWIRTDWTGAATLVGGDPQFAPVWNAQGVVARWHIEAWLTGAQGSLRISGILVR